jgi:protein TonB
MVSQGSITLLTDALAIAAVLTLFGCTSTQTSSAAPAAACAEPLQKARILSLGKFPSYPAAARGQSAIVKVTLNLDASGKVTGARFEKIAGSGFDEAVLGAARTMQFAPATRCGVPVPSEFTLKARFETGHP